MKFGEKKGRLLIIIDYLISLESVFMCFFILNLLYKCDTDNIQYYVHNVLHRLLIDFKYMMAMNREYLENSQSNSSGNFDVM